MAPRQKNITFAEKEFCRLQVEAGLSPYESARKTLGMRCEPGSRECGRVQSLMRMPRVKNEFERLKAHVAREIEASSVLNLTAIENIDNLKKFAYIRLSELRDDPNANSTVRFAAVTALEKLHDPSTDINLVFKWIDILWQYVHAHCPSCHKTFPLMQIQNKALEKYYESMQITPPEKTRESFLETRLHLLKMADKRKIPHASQLMALAAPERHIVGKAAARAGKSLLLAMFALFGILLPGVEIWLIARIYEDAGQEADYLKAFLKSLFHPFEDKYIKIREDKMNGELIITTKWNSVLKIRSAKSKGSLTARELELALIAEPGWVDDSIYEEVRARMSSRLGRIIALGTPKGATGFLARLVRATGRDPVTRQIVRLTPEKRLIANGCPWGQSMLIYNLNPTDNPEYVKSELEAARLELTDVEYASEFEGKIVTLEGAKYPCVTPEHIKYLPRQFFRECKFVLGIDQGPKNFGACLTAWNGDIAAPCYEFFDSSEKTMKANLKFLLSRVPVWISMTGGDPNNWVLTITDRHPPIQTTFLEMAQEGLEWKTEIAERHQNNLKIGDNWRRECQEFINEMSKQNKLLFHLSEIKTPFTDMESPGATLLHDQVIQVLDRPEADTRESGEGESKNKGWIVNDPWRGDHVIDAWLFTMWTIMSDQVSTTAPQESVVETPLIEHQRALHYMIAAGEAKELGMKQSSNEIFESIFHRKRARSTFGRPGYFSDES